VLGSAKLHVFVNNEEDKNEASVHPSPLILTTQPSPLTTPNPHAHPHPHPSVIYQELMEISLAFTDIARAAASSREAAAATAS